MAEKKLLVADDSLTIQKVIRLALSNEGYEIQTVSDGHDAVQQISLFRPNIVLIDISLPGKSAFEVKREINNFHDFEEIRFVLMSSAFEKVDEVQMREVGFHGNLTKPFDPSHLRQILIEALAQITKKRAEKTGPLSSESRESRESGEPEALGKSRKPETVENEKTATLSSLGHPSPPFELSVPASKAPPPSPPPLSAPSLSTSTKELDLKKEQGFEPLYQTESKNELPDAENESDIWDVGQDPATLSNLPSPVSHSSSPSPKSRASGPSPLPLNEPRTGTLPLPPAPKIKFPQKETASSSKETSEPQRWSAGFTIDVPEIRTSVESPPLDSSEEEKDIAELTSSTFQLNDTSEFQWNVNEPTLRPSANMVDKGASSFRLEEAEPKTKPLGQTRHADLSREPTLAPNFQNSPNPPVTASHQEDEVLPDFDGLSGPDLQFTDPALTTSPLLTSPVPNNATSLSQGQIEVIVRQEVQHLMEKIIQNLVPELAEKMIKEEIHRILSDT